MSQRFTIQYAGAGRDPCGRYEYDVLDGSCVIARYWHDYRGEDHGIHFSDGSEELPFGRPSDFVKGGGPQPLKLSAAAIRWLDERSSRWQITDKPQTEI